MPLPWRWSLLFNAVHSCVGRGPGASSACATSSSMCVPALVVPAVFQGSIDGHRRVEDAQEVPVPRASDPASGSWLPVVRACLPQAALHHMAYKDLAARSLFTQQGACGCAGGQGGWAARRSAEVTDLKKPG